MRFCNTLLSTEGLFTLVESECEKRMINWEKHAIFCCASCLSAWTNSWKKLYVDVKEKRRDKYYKKECNYSEFPGDDYCIWRREVVSIIYTHICGKNRDEEFRFFKRRFYMFISFDSCSKTYQISNKQPLHQWW